MFEWMKDKYLERHVRQKIEEFYGKYGLTIQEVQTMSIVELEKRMTEVLMKLEMGVETLQSQLAEKTKTVADLTKENRLYREKVEDLNLENWSLRNQQQRNYVKEQQQEKTIKEPVKEKTFENEYMTAKYTPEADIDKNIMMFDGIKIDLNSFHERKGQESEKSR